MITDIQQLAAYCGARTTGPEGMSESISRRVYKDTNCGAWVKVVGSKVHVGSIASARLLEAAIPQSRYLSRAVPSFEHRSTAGSFPAGLEHHVKVIDAAFWDHLLTVRFEGIAPDKVHVLACAIADAARAVVSKSRQ